MIDPVQAAVLKNLSRAMLQQVAVEAGPADGIAVEVSEDKTALRLRFVQGEDTGGGVYVVLDAENARALCDALQQACDTIDPADELGEAVPA